MCLQTADAGALLFYAKGRAGIVKEPYIYIAHWEPCVLLKNNVLAVIRAPYASYGLTV